MTLKQNDELRHEWRVSLQQGRGLAQSTIQAKLAALRDFETFTSGRSFLKLRQRDVTDFKEHLLTVPSAVTGECLSCSTVVHVLEHCRDFYSWLADRKDGRHLDPEAIQWLTATRADKERARSVPPKPVPSLAEAEAAFAAMPDVTLQNRRDRAVFATLLLTAIRADALASLTLGSIDLSKSSVWQDSRVVRTKNSKSFTVYLMPFFPKAREALEAWMAELSDLGLCSSDALFPRDTELVRIEAGDSPKAGEFPVWARSTQVRAIVRNGFEAAGLPRHSPHVFRHMMAKHVLSLRPPAEDLIAFSINLGHNRLETTVNPYGRPDEETRGRLIAGLGANADLPANADLEAVFKRLLQEDPEKAAAIFRALARR
ncbi:MAG: tyrosine-type recombinase/integrase [Beijerinckiaceae bacterium]|nr:tyrosine-type recombinase/integrase [Beijerinckiaceae bacterium]